MHPVTKSIQTWGEYDQANIPEIDVSFKINMVSDLNEAEGTYEAIFTLMLDWEDYSVCHEYERLKEENKNSAVEKHIQDEINFDDHFMPSYEIRNIKALEKIGGAAKPRIKSTSEKNGGKKGYYVTLTQKYRA